MLRPQRPITTRSNFKFDNLKLLPGWQPKKRSPDVEIIITRRNRT